jgi:hypothetical protein
MQNEGKNAIRISAVQIVAGELKNKLARPGKKCESFNHRP